MPIFFVINDATVNSAGVRPGTKVHEAAEILQYETPNNVPSIPNYQGATVMNASVFRMSAANIAEAQKAAVTLSAGSNDTPVVIAEAAYKLA